MGVYALETAQCSTSTLTALQKALNGAGNAFCFLDTHTAVNLPDTYNVDSIDLSLKKLDVAEKSASAEWDGAAVTLVVLAALCAVAAAYLFARHLRALPFA